jgi:outer membrane autotransporter protein
MDWSYSREQLASTLRRLSPEMYTSYLSAGLEGSTIFDGALQRRQDEARLAGKHNLHRGPQGEGLLAAVAEEAAPQAEIPAAGPELQGWELWGGALGSWSSRAGGGGRLGWRQDLGGLAGGLDGKITDWLSLGLGLGATQSRLDWGQSYLSGGLKGLHTGLYAGAEAGGLHGQAALTYSQYQANSRRDIDLPSGSAGQATGDFRSWVGQARLSGGYEWHWQDWLTGPIAGLRYARIQQDGFQEGGAGACSLGVEDADQDSLTSRLGWQASVKRNLGSLEIMPSLSLEWQHEFAAGDPEITARFPGYGDAPFRVSGQAPVADMALLRAGLNLRVRERLAAFVEYGASYGGSYSANAIQAGLQFQF